MNKINKIFLSILAGIETTFYLFTPILLSTLWVSVSNVEGMAAYFFYAIGFLSTTFRGFKIGWMK
jgi:hypothetical protein